MIVQCDVKGLEVVCAAWLSKDKVLYNELNTNVDIHQANQDAFGLPNRLIAKILKFRTIYGGNEYSFANDPDFTPVSSSTKYWKKVLEKYFDKYYGLASWHNKICSEVGKTGKLTTPLGRTFQWDCMKFGSFKIPSTQVKNHPVQGTGADVVSIARVLLHRRWKKANISGVLVNTVHDSIVADVEKKDVDKVAELYYNVFRDVPRNINNIFDVDFDLETKVEILVGQDMYNLVEYK
jgi:DNA polymerase-1